MNKLLDLRFVIGLFFLATGSLLTAYYFISDNSAFEYPTVNMWCGLGFLCFGMFMVLLSAKTKNPDQN